MGRTTHWDWLLTRAAVRSSWPIRQFSTYVNIPAHKSHVPTQGDQPMTATAAFHGELLASYLAETPIYPPTRVFLKLF